MLGIKNILTRLAFIVPCHRKPERCLKINGKPMPICARCFSMLLGYLFIPIIFYYSIPLWIGVMCQLPMITDGYTQKLKLRTSNNYLRVATGLLSGFGLSVCIVSISNIITYYLI